MEKYNNEELIKKEIMDQSRHLFIYGYPTEQRTIFLKSLEKEYPIKIDETSPMGIYLEDYGLPAVKVTNKELGQGRLDIISDSYLSLSLISKILKNIVLQDKDKSEEKLRELLDFINRCCKQKKIKDANNIKELITLFEESKRLYKDFYLKHATEGSVEKLFDDIPIPFIDGVMTSETIKESIGNKSYFGLIIDHNKKISPSSQRAINNLISGRINSDISIKLATSPNDWETYVTQNNQYIEYVHDYSYVELDDSYKKTNRR